MRSIRCRVARGRRRPRLVHGGYRHPGEVVDDRLVPAVIALVLNRYIVSGLLAGSVK